MRSTNNNECSYVQAHNLIRSITGIGKGPIMTIHDGFRALSTWADVLDGSDRVALGTYHIPFRPTK